MQKCPYCGTENRDEESFCEHCGGFLDPYTTTTTEGESVQASNSQSLTLGSHLQNGRYVIKKVLGQGGMGSVALAGDPRLADKLVFIKELIADPADPTEDVRNFTYQVQTLPHLYHPLVPCRPHPSKEGAAPFLDMLH